MTMRVRWTVLALGLILGALAGCRSQSQDKTGTTGTPIPAVQEEAPAPSPAPETPPETGVSSPERTPESPAPEPPASTGEIEAPSETTATAEEAPATTDAQQATTAAEVQATPPAQPATAAELTSSAAQLRSRLTQLSSATGGRLSPADAQRVRSDVEKLAQSLRNNPTLDKDQAYEAWDRATQTGMTMTELELSPSPEDAQRLTSAAVQQLQELERLLQDSGGDPAP